MKLHPRLLPQVRLQPPLPWLLGIRINNPSALGLFNEKRVKRTGNPDTLRTFVAWRNEAKKALHGSFRQAEKVVFSSFLAAFVFCASFFFRSHPLNLLWRDEKCGFFSIEGSFYPDQK